MLVRCVCRFMGITDEAWVALRNSGLFFEQASWVPMSCLQPASGFRLSEVRLGALSIVHGLSSQPLLPHQVELQNLLVPAMPQPPLTWQALPAPR